MRIAALFVVAFAAIASAQELSAGMRAEAEALWNRYVALEAAFDPAVADLYADDALIQNKRTYPTGEVRVAAIPAPQYKMLVRQAIPLAKAQNDRSRYSGCRYGPEAGRVRIVCSRYSVLKDYASTIALLVGPGPTGTWVIHEELSESRP
jgi:hypothetical protein